MGCDKMVGGGCGGGMVWRWQRLGWLEMAGVGIVWSWQGLRWLEMAGVDMV